MAQNIYDTAEFFEGYSRLPRSLHGLDGAPEWPAIRALLPDLRGKRVVDLGCGFGWFARWAGEQGAARVVGFDLSANMIERARRDTAGQRIAYQIADLETLELPVAAYDFAYSSLAFHYIEDFARLVRMVHQALIPGARFVFTIEHPIYMAPANPGWSVADDGRVSWPVDGYSVEGRRITDWLAKGVVKYHRTIGSTLNTLIGSGFAIRSVVEFAPTADQIADNPRLATEIERPMILIVSTER
jgi:SAM-dependent methyltransferase